MAARTLAEGARAGAEADAAGRPAARDGSGRWALAALVVALVPLGSALVRAFGRWTSVGDNALITLRSVDVLTSYHPLLGTWTSASTSIGVDFNNPGPLQFDLLALPAKLLPHEGPAIAVVLVHALSIVGIFVLARRLGGAVTAAVAMLVAVALTWSMGSDVLVEPWQPHSLLLPFLLLLFLVWSTSCGEHRSLPWLVAVGSLIVQTHVSYSILVPALCAWGVAGLVLARRQHLADRPGRDGGERRTDRALHGHAVGGVGRRPAAMVAAPVLRPGLVRRRAGGPPSAAGRRPAGPRRRGGIARPGPGPGGRRRAGGPPPG
jgi:hypothetical protein